jgi:hypothetical protein
MPKKEARVIDFFNTSLGLIVILSFEKNAIPVVGMWIEKDNILAWRISQIGLRHALEKSLLYKGKIDDLNLWSCNLETLDSSMKLNKNDIVLLSSNN